MEKQVTGHWKKFTDREFLGAYEFEEGEIKTAKIAKVTQNPVINPKTNKPEDKIVVYFDVLKPLIVNSTNSKAIEKMAKSGKVEDWVGTTIAMHTDKVKAFGDIWDVVRILDYLPKPKAKVNCESCGAVIETVNINGTIYEPEDYAAMSKNKLGKVLCIKCAKEKNKKEEK